MTTSLFSSDNLILIMAVVSTVYALVCLIRELKFRK